MHRRSFVVFALLVLGVSSTLVLADVALPSVYMPMVLQGPPTPTPTSTAIPTATDTPTPQPTATQEPTATPTTPPPTPTQNVRSSCTDNPPPTVEGAQAWVTNARPPQNTDETVCAQLIVNGSPQANIPVAIVVNYDSGPVRYAGLTDSNGLVSTTFGIGNATIGLDVAVDVNFATLQVANTDFVPQ